MDKHLLQLLEQTEPNYGIKIGMLHQDMLCHLVWVLILRQKLKSWSILTVELLMLSVLIIVLFVLNKNNLEDKDLIKFQMELMELKIDFQLFGQKELSKDISLKINLLRKHQPMLLKYLECILIKVLSDKVQMLILLFGILILRKLFHQKLIIIPLIIMFLKD